MVDWRRILLGRVANCAAHALGAREQQPGLQQPELPSLLGPPLLLRGWQCPNSLWRAALQALARTPWARQTFESD